jgi:FAD/FMN-containing dehydrogenase
LTRDDLKHALARVVGDGHVLADPELRAAYERDFTGRYGAESLMVVRPADAVQVAEVVRVCIDHAVAVVPQGGNTGLVGGGVPRGGEVLLSTRRLNQIGRVDEITGHLLVGAGATLASVQTTALRAGWEMPLDLGAREAATVGGLVATDAGGAMALAHGTMRERVAGLAVVLPDGRIVERLGGLLKDNAGYAWPSLIVGSEGTLGIITSVLVRLIPRAAARVAVLFAVRDLDDAMQLLMGLRRSAPSLQAADFFFDDGVTLVERVLDGVHLPVEQRAPVYLLVECAERATRRPSWLSGQGNGAPHRGPGGGGRHRRTARASGAPGGTARGARPHRRAREGWTSPCRWRTWCGHARGGGAGREHRPSRGDRPRGTPRRRERARERSRSGGRVGRRGGEVLRLATGLAVRSAPSRRRRQQGATPRTRALASRSSIYFGPSRRRRTPSG